jgi:hypothetical protein
VLCVTLSAACSQGERPPVAPPQAVQIPAGLAAPVVLEEAREIVTDVDLAAGYLRRGAALATANARLRAIGCLVTRAGGCAALVAAAREEGKDDGE